LQWGRLSALTGYTVSSLTSCLNDLLALFAEAASSPHPAIREKYSKDKYAVKSHALFKLLLQCWLRPDTELCILQFILKTAVA